MSKCTSTLSIAAVLAASALVLQAPVASAADYDSKSSAAPSAETQAGVPGVDVDVGKNASDKGLPGVEMNAGKDGDQQNLNTETNKLGASSDMNSDGTKHKAARKDRN